VLADRAGYDIVGVYTEKASGARNDRIERKKVMGLAQARQIDAVLSRSSAAGVGAPRT
jgi:putative DNA-invertase from lambdoid prophage Rac